MKYILPVIIFLSFVTASCKKVIDLNLDSTASQLVIEGNVTDQAGPQIVTITKSVNFNNTNSFPNVTGATVKLTDNNGVVHPLTERSPGVYSTTSFMGITNKIYTLQVQYNGQTYTAVSTMPKKVLIDSVALSTQIFVNSITKTIIIFYRDPPKEPNQYRFVMYINSVQVKQVFARNDQFNNGRDVQLLLYQDDIKLKSGDKVDIEMQCIDPAVYTYWYTFSQQQGYDYTATTPTNPPNNFNTDKVLGYFSVHTSQHKNIIIP